MTPHPSAPERFGPCPFCRKPDRYLTVYGYCWGCDPGPTAPGSRAAKKPLPATWGRA